MKHYFVTITPSKAFPDLMFNRISCKFSDAKPCKISLYEALYVYAGTKGCLLLSKPIWAGLPKIFDE